MIYDAEYFLSADLTFTDGVLAVDRDYNAVLTSESSRNRHLFLLLRSNPQRIPLMRERFTKRKIWNRTAGV
jgi:hypothetical protein